jgi:hypothetical protein
MTGRPPGSATGTKVAWGTDLPRLAIATAGGDPGAGSGS